MKIQKVRFKNLNSLVGEWEIDFTHPNYMTDGIFAITGPTGAGKTTILDAICLALYGRTPRLSKVTKGANEIMSRQTGDCFAEVTFQTQTGGFCCHWSQHRSRKRPDGELQAPRHEMSDCSTGRIFEASLRGVSDQIEVATGMDFQRFTRSMMLAQGGFAVFLQATPDEKAPILEQITGTEIYSLLSMRVHERRVIERKIYDDFALELSGIQPMGEAEESSLRADLHQKLQMEAELSSQLDWTAKAIAWKDKVHLLELELEKVQSLILELEARQEAFAPQVLRLERANKALELAGDFAELSTLRRAQEADFSARSESAAELPSSEGAAVKASERVDRASEKVKATKEALREASPLLRSVRELDTKLSERDSRILIAQQELLKREEALKSLRDAHESDLSQLNTHTAALTDLSGQMLTIQTDETLSSVIAGINLRIDSLMSLEAQRAAKVNEVHSLEDQVAESIGARDALRHTQSEHNVELESVKREYTNGQNSLSQVIGECSIAGWRDRAVHLKDRKFNLNRARETLDAVMELEVKQNTLRPQIEALEVRKTALTEQIDAREQVCASLEKSIELLEANALLLNRIHSFEDSRTQLRDGEPCPLCGSLEHPFAEGNVPLPDEARNELTSAKTVLRETAESVADMKVGLARVGTELELSASSLFELDSQLKTSMANVDKIAIELSLDGAQESRHFMTGLCTLLTETEVRLANAEHIISTAETVERELEEHRTSLELLKEAVSQLDLDAQEAAHRADMLSQQLAGTNREIESLAVKFSIELAQLRKEILPYGCVDKLDIPTEETFAALKEELSMRRNRWTAAEKERLELERQVDSLSIRTTHQKEQLVEAESEYRSHRDLFDALSRGRETLYDERHQLFEDRRPDDVELKLTQETELAEAEYASACETHAEAVRAHALLVDRLKGLDEALSARVRQLEFNGSRLTARMLELGFSDETDYTSACLNESLRKDLSSEAKKIADEASELASRASDRAFQLETLLREGITEEPSESLKQSQVALTASRSELQQEIGALRQRLADDESLKLKQAQKIRALSVQKAELERWDRLHELIGSADGKKFRNFAQGLTFDLMIGHANRQLSRLTDRYLLVRDEVQPLDLNVVDNYQAGEVRSTKNLSGGESFLVSLALALGLSRMASRNVRVDSLFLDEGFGTLDEEALDSALGALAGLQQDGKLIGIISHINALKERINTQIIVSPRSGGKSAITGPGCYYRT